MPEFVKVVFTETRDVFIDNVRQGRTGETQRVARGHHRFDLGNPLNYTPSSIIEAIMNTTQSNPRIIKFAPVAVAAAERSVAAARAASPAAGFAIASRNSSMFHTSQSCPAASQITDNNKVFGDEARRGRTVHQNCG